ncbi:hypothetical protein [Crocinitomix algicola]|uniref:hypothetical protein n=1 Tax=Crocinitomix algicola TaxID=1740263 RepID=UPI00087218A5|nr:hypothetical protein [Crocinitomix algicola]
MTISRINIIVLHSVFLFFIYSCNNSKKIISDSETLQNFQLNDTVSFTLGKTYHCQDDIDLFVSYDSLISDSRCPIGAECFWEGEAEAKFKINYKKQLDYLNLKTNKQNNTVDVFGYKFQLLEITPYPGSKNENSELEQAVLVIKK